MEINGRRVDSRKQQLLERSGRVLVSTRGGGGYDPARARDRALPTRNRGLGYAERTGWSRRRAPTLSRGASYEVAGLPALDTSSRLGGRPADR